LKYTVGDVVFVNQGRRGDFYRPLNRIAIIIEEYDIPGVDGYKIMVQGSEETFFVEDKYVQGKLDEV
jgi:hypothetical protein